MASNIPEDSLEYEAQLEDIKKQIAEVNSDIKDLAGYTSDTPFNADFIAPTSFTVRDLSISSTSIDYTLIHFFVRISFSERPYCQYDFTTNSTYLILFFSTHPLSCPSQTHTFSLSNRTLPSMFMLETCQLVSLVTNMTS